MFEGATGCGMYEMATRLYEDGTPKTRHLTTNARIEVDDEAGTAHRAGVLLRHPGDAELPLQLIITGRYRDTFHRIDGTWWFDTRVMFVDQVGDISHHLKF